MSGLRWPVRRRLYNLISDSPGHYRRPCHVLRGDRWPQAAWRKKFQELDRPEMVQACGGCAAEDRGKIAVNPRGHLTKTA